MHYKSLYDMQPHVSVVDKEVTGDMTLVLSDSDVNLLAEVFDHAFAENDVKLCAL